MRRMLPLSLIALIAVFAVIATAPLSAEDAPAAGADGFKKIFNGKDLTGWEGVEELWRVEDGAIVGETTAEKKTKGNTFLVWRDGTLKDFHLRCQFKLEGGNNSGIQYRSKEMTKYVMTGYQCDLNKGFPNMCKLYHEKNPRGRICMGGEVVVYDETAKKQIKGETPEIEKLKTAEKPGEWNTCEIIAKGNHIIHKLNGVVVIDFTDDDTKNRCMEGLLALQIHAGAPMKISYKDIEVKELKD